MNLSLAVLLSVGVLGVAQARPRKIEGRKLKVDRKRKEHRKLRGNEKLKDNLKRWFGATLKGSEATRRLDGDGCPDFYEDAPEGFMEFFLFFLDEFGAPPGSHISSLGVGRLIDVNGGALEEVSYTGEEMDLSFGDIPQDVYGCIYTCIDPPLLVTPCEGECLTIREGPGRRLEYEGLPNGASWKEGDGEDIATNLCTCYFENPESPVAASPTVRTDVEGDLDVGCTFCLNCNACEQHLPFLTQDLYDELTGTEGRDAAYANVNDFCIAVNHWNEMMMYEHEGAYTIFASEDEGENRAALAAFFGNAAASSEGFAYTRDPAVCESSSATLMDDDFFGLPVYGCQPEGWEEGSDYDDPYCLPPLEEDRCFCPGMDGGVVGPHHPEGDFAAYINAHDLYMPRGPLRLTGNVEYLQFYEFFYNDDYYCEHPDDVALVEGNLWLSAFFLWIGSNEEEGLSFGASMTTFSEDEEGCAADLDRLDFYCKAAGILDLEELLSMDGCDGLEDTLDTCACDGTCPSCSSFVECPEPPASLVVNGVFSVNADVCNLDADDLEAFILGALEVLQAKSPEGALAIINNVCGKSVSLDEGARRLQSNDPSDSWNVAYSIISTLACGSPGCTDQQDIAAIEATVNSIADTFRDAIASGDLATELSQNANVQSALESTILDCLVAWGTVYGDAATFDSGDPLPAANTTNLFYPDWTGNSGTCINDGDEPLYMKLDEDNWLYDTLEGCCGRYFPGWNLAKCMNTQGTGLWYVSYMDERCVTDCEEGSGGETCGGIAAPISTELYSDPRACCEAKLQWIFLDFCENDSLLNECYGGTGKWYRGSNSELCVRDCDPNVSDTCGGMVDEYWVRLHDTAEECCAAEHSWIDEDLCAARSTGIPTDMFWPDKLEGKCINDTETPVEDLSVSLYESAEDCCAEINWVPVDTCVSDATGVPISTDPGSEKWFFYSRGVEQKCAKLCEGAAPCGGLDPDGVGVNDYFDDLESCCGRLNWVARDECELS